MKNCGQKILVQSDAQLDTLRKIPGKFQLNPSCRLGGVVVTRLFHFEESQTYLRTDVKIFCQMHNQTHKEKFPEDFSSIHPAVQEELSGQDILILMTYGLTYGLTVKVFVRCTTRHLKENFLKISAQSIQPFRRSCPDKIFLKR